MKEETGRGDSFEAAAYTFIAAVTVGAIYYLYYYRPALYIRFITEDQWGEYGTAVCFALAAALLLVLAWKPGPLPRRILWTLGVIFALLIFAEEINWGQRILRYPVPESFRAINVQGEFNLHNIGFLDELNREGLHRGAGSAVLGWALFSWLLSLWSPRLAAGIRDTGLPLIPTRLQPMFLPVPYFFLLSPVAKSSEIGELVLGMAVSAWAIDLFLRYGMAEIPHRKKAAALMAGFFILGVFLSLTMTRISPGSMKMRLNLTASRDYPAYGMYEQAESLFQYIYAHPENLLPDTRINHGRMLIKKGDRESAVRVLAEALEEMEDRLDSGAREGAVLRQKGIIHALLGATELAEKNLTHAIEIERLQAEHLENSDEKAELLWSVARSLEALGNLSEAVSTALQAKEMAQSAQMQGALERWILSLNHPADGDRITDPL